MSFFQNCRVSNRLSSYMNLNLSFFRYMYLFRINYHILLFQNSWCRRHSQEECSSFLINVWYQMRERTLAKVRWNVINREGSKKIQKGDISSLTIHVSFIWYGLCTLFIKQFMRIRILVSGWYDQLF